LDDGKNIVKALNMVMIKLLDNSDRTACFIILLQQLKESIPSLDGPPQPPSKLTDLIMKCLLKLTKVINTTIKSLHVDAILREIHLFLVTHPPQKWKDRDHTPLKAVKTLLNEIVKYKGSF
jgi:cytoskeleton-associated protein 5